MRKTGLGIAAALAVALLLPAALPALAAEEVTREGYKAAVEPICKKNSKANENILRGVRKKVRQGKLKQAGRQFVRAARALKKTLRQLRAAPRPAADEARLGEWLKRIGKQKALLQRIGKALIGKKRRLAERLSTRLISGARLTNAIVVGFGFRYCRFEPSKYT
jgi:hypothetical protein